MIDTLRFANRLKRAGFTEQQSEAFAEAWAEQARDDLPSRSDIIALDGKIDRIHTELEGRIDRVQAELEGRIDRSHVELNGKIDRVYAGLDGKIDRVRTELEGRMSKLTWMVGFTLAGVAAVLIRLLFVGVPA